MGLPARRIEERVRTTRRAPDLRLVKGLGTKRRPPARRVGARAGEARARTVFWLFTVSFVSLCALGGIRVAVIVRASEMSMSEVRLQASIKAQRIEGDQLEVDRSSLSTPSRIEGIASTSMRMAPPRSINYISLSGASATATPDAATSPGQAALGDARERPTGIAALFAAVMDMSAGEAQSLLVGELGLAGSR